MNGWCGSGNEHCRKKGWAPWAWPAIGDVSGGMQLLGHACAPGLAAGGKGQAWRGNRVGRTNQALGIRRLRPQPAPPVAVLLVGVTDGQAYVLETVVGQTQLERLILVPALPHLLPVHPRVWPRRFVRAARLASWPGRRDVGDVLKMGLADEAGAVARLAQQVDKGGFPERKLAAVHRHAVRARHAGRHQRGAIRLAHRGGNVEIVENAGLTGDAVDVPRRQHRIAVAAQVVGAMLVSDEQQEVRTLHGRRAPQSALMPSSRAIAP